MIKPSLYSKLVEEIPKLIDEEEDSVRIYRIVGSGEVTMFGVNKQVENEDIIIV
jgi:CRISPR/Cas system-associated endoribonuclease Cas2